MASITQALTRALTQPPAVAPADFRDLGGASNRVNAYDFVNGTYTVNGASTTAAAAVAGTVRTFTDDFLGDNWGAKTDPAYSNLYSVDLSTAVTGTVGSGGALPTGWSFVNSSTLGLNCDVTNISADEVQIRMYGTPSSSGNLRILMASTSAIVTSVSSPYNVAYEVQQVGSITGVSPGTGGDAFAKGVRFLTSAGSFVSDSFAAGNRIRSDDNIYVPTTTSVTTPATGARLQPMFGIIGISNGVAFDATFKIRRNQVTAGTGQMQYLGRGASASADDLTLNNLGTLLSGDFSSVVTARLPPDNNSGSLFEIGSGNNRIEVLHSSYSVSINVVNNGSSTSTTLGLVIPWMRTKVALSVQGGAVTASLNGKPAVSCGTAPSLSGMKVGNGTTGPLRGSIEACSVYGSAKSSAQVKALAALSGAMYDDFDRADGAVGTAWTGQTYEQTGTAASSVISSKRVVTTDSGGGSTSAYFLTDMGAKPKIGGGAMAWENQAGNASAGLICTPNDTSISGGSAASGITAGSAHFLAAPGGLFAGKYASNVLTDHQWNYTVSPTKDGVTIGAIVWKLRSSDGAMAVRLVSGEIVYFAGENYYAAAGRYFVNESFWNVATPAKPIWANWGCEV